MIVFFAGLGLMGTAWAGTALFEHSPEVSEAPWAVLWVLGILAFLVGGVMWAS